MVDLQSFYKEGNFCDFLLAFQYTWFFPKKKSTLKGDNLLPRREQIRPFLSRPLYRKQGEQFDKVASPEKYAQAFPITVIHKYNRILSFQNIPRSEGAGARGVGYYLDRVSFPKVYTSVFNVFHNSIRFFLSIFTLVMLNKLRCDAHF